MQPEALGPVLWETTWRRVALSNALFGLLMGAALCSAFVSWWGWAAFPVFTALAMASFRFRGVPRLLAKQRRSLPMTERDVRLSQDGISIDHVNGAKSFTPWGIMSRAKRAYGLWRFEVSGLNYFIPLRYLSPDAERFLRERLQASNVPIVES